MGYDGAGYRAGAILVGSHAFGALLNALGVRAVPYATEDIDIARRESLVLLQLALPQLPGFLEMLRATGIEFYEVPSLDRGAPPTSYAERGGSRLRVVSQLRTKVSGKPEKDLRQAATLIEAVTERFPGAVQEALTAVPKSSVRCIRRAVEALERHLPGSAEAAWDALEPVRARH